MSDCDSKEWKGDLVTVMTTMGDKLQVRDSLPAKNYDMNCLARVIQGLAECRDAKLNMTAAQAEMISLLDEQQLRDLLKLFRNVKVNIQAANKSTLDRVAYGVSFVRLVAEVTEKKIPIPDDARRRLWELFLVLLAGYNDVLQWPNNTDPSSLVTYLTVRCELKRTLFRWGSNNPKQLKDMAEVLLHVVSQEKTYLHTSTTKAELTAVVTQILTLLELNSEQTLATCQNTISKVEEQIPLVPDPNLGMKWKEQLNKHQSRVTRANDQLRLFKEIVDQRCRGACTLAVESLTQLHDEVTQCQSQGEAIQLEVLTAMKGKSLTARQNLSKGYLTVKKALFK